MTQKKPVGARFPRAPWVVRGSVDDEFIPFGCVVTTLLTCRFCFIVSRPHWSRMSTRESCSLVCLQLLELCPAHSNCSLRWMVRECMQGWLKIFFSLELVEVSFLPDLRKFHYYTNGMFDFMLSRKIEILHWVLELICVNHFSFYSRKIFTYK